MKKVRTNADAFHEADDRAASMREKDRAPLCRSGSTPAEPASKPASPPPIAGEADPEYQTRLDANRVTAEFGVKSARPLDAGKKPITDSPLFGGEAQGNLFGGNE
jgi:hypothetical protein